MERQVVDAVWITISAGPEHSFRGRQIFSVVRSLAVLVNFICLAWNRSRGLLSEPQRQIFTSCASFLDWRKCEGVNRKRSELGYPSKSRSGGLGAVGCPAARLFLSAATSGVFVCFVQFETICAIQKQVAKRILDTKRRNLHSSEPEGCFCKSKKSCV